MITALTAIYSWYRANEGMIGNTERDAPELPALAQSQTRAPTSTRSRRMLGRPAACRRSAHALAFSTWRLADAAAACQTTPQRR